MKICFIDDDLRMTYKVMEAMKDYYADITQNDTLECSMILINLDSVREETLKYYQELFKTSKFELKICGNLEVLEEVLEEVNTDSVLFMVDLFMINDENKKMEESSEYKCVSMKCMDILEKMEVKYKWYSAYLESAFKDEWQKRYQRIYKRKIPKIYERNNLVQAYFKKEIAKEILEV